MIFYKINLLSAPRVLNFGVFRFVNMNNSFSPLRGSLLEFAVVQQQPIRFESEKESCTINEDDFFCFTKNTVGRASTTRKNESHYHISILMAVDYICEEIDTSSSLNVYKKLSDTYYSGHEIFALIPRQFSITNQTQFSKMLHEVTVTGMCRSAGNYLQCISVWYKILAELTNISMRMISETSQKPSSPAYSVYTTRAISYMNEHIGKKIKARDISANLNLTPNYLNHIFKSSTGYSLMAYFNKLRVNRIKSYLKRALR